DSVREADHRVGEEVAGVGGERDADGTIAEGGSPPPDGDHHAHRAAGDGPSPLPVRGLAAPAREPGGGAGGDDRDYEPGGEADDTVQGRRRAVPRDGGALERRTHGRKDAHPDDGGADGEAEEDDGRSHGALA